MNIVFICVTHKMNDNGIKTRLT